jgi:hypothetical protein
MKIITHFHRSSIDLTAPPVPPIDAVTLQEGHDTMAKQYFWHLKIDLNKIFQLGFHKVPFQLLKQV